MDRACRVRLFAYPKQVEKVLKKPMKWAFLETRCSEQPSGKFEKQGEIAKVTWWNFVICPMTYYSIMAW